jgi:hypothetical protein
MGENVRHLGKSVRQKPDTWKTEKGLEYKGRTHVYGIKGENNRELVMEEPKQIFRDKNGKVIKELPMGAEILFLQNDIRHIVFLEELRSNKEQ